MQRMRRILAIAMVVLAITAYWCYRNKLAVVHAAQYLPASSTLPLVPAGTEIRVVLSNGITEGTRPGDVVKAFISRPVLAANVPVLPTGIQFNGTVEQIDKASNTARVQIRFDKVWFNGRSSPIDADVVLAAVPLTSDINTLANGFNTITGAGIGLALGTASQDTRAAAEGLAQGAFTGVPQPTVQSPEVTVVLNRPLQVLAR